MIIPVRCFTCGKVVADKWRAYELRTKEVGSDGKPEDKAKVLDDLNLSVFVVGECSSPTWTSWISFGTTDRTDTED
jgi:DNA-directed RNA polymerase subunit N (RpoN/RPB10)